MSFPLKPCPVICLASSFVPEPSMLEHRREPVHGLRSCLRGPCSGLGPRLAVGARPGGGVAGPGVLPV